MVLISEEQKKMHHHEDERRMEPQSALLRGKSETQTLPHPALPLPLSSARLGAPPLPAAPRLAAAWAVGTLVGVQVGGRRKGE